MFDGGGRERAESERKRHQREGQDRIILSYQSMLATQTVTNGKLIREGTTPREDQLCRGVPGLS